MLFGNPILNVVGGPTFNSGYALMVAGFNSSGTTTQVDKIAFDGSGTRTGNACPTGQRDAVAFGNSTVGIIQGGGYASSGAVTNINNARQTVYTVTYGADTWATASITLGVGRWGCATTGNATTGFIYGGISGNSITPAATASQSFDYSSDTFTSLFSYTGFMPCAVGNATDAYIFGGETNPVSSSYTQTYVNTTVTYNYASQTTGAPSPVIAARAGLTGASGPTAGMMVGGAIASSIYNTTWLYTYSSATLAASSATTAVSAQMRGGAASRTNAYFAGGSLTSGSILTATAATGTVDVYNWAAATRSTGTAITARDGASGLSSAPPNF